MSVLARLFGTVSRVSFIGHTTESGVIHGSVTVEYFGRMTIPEIEQDIQNRYLERMGIFVTSVQIIKVVDL